MHEQLNSVGRFLFQTAEESRGTKVSDVKLQQSFVQKAQTVKGKVFVENDNY